MMYGHPNLNPITLDGPYRRQGFFTRLICRINWHLANLANR